VVAVVALAGWAMLPTPSSATLQARPFDWSTIQQARKDGRVVMVKFTATWCAKCIQQDYAIFDRSELAETLEQLDVLYIKADVSRGDMPAAKWMKQNGYGVAIPMTLVYPGPGEPIGPLRSDLTLQQLIETLHRAAERSDPPP
jgi:thiol:disulfide interchange protein